MTTPAPAVEDLRAQLADLDRKVAEVTITPMEKFLACLGDAELARMRKLVG